MKRKFENIPIIFIIAVLIFSAQFLIHFPDFLGFKNTPENMWYTGQVSWFDPWDINPYFNMIRLGRKSWLFKNYYTTEKQPGAPIHTTYIILGKLAKLFSLSDILTFHLAAIFLGSIFLWLLYRFIHFFVSDYIKTILIFSLAVFGGGLGWIFFNRIAVPDINLTGFMLVSQLKRPHEAVSSIFYLLTLFTAFKTITERKIKFFPSLFVSTLLLCFLHVYMILAVLTITFIFSLLLSLRKKQAFNFFPLLLEGMAAGFFGLLTLKSFIFNPSFQGLVKQQQSSANPLLMLLGFGFMTPFLFVSLIKPAKTSKLTFIKVWFLSQFFLLYLPLGFQKLFLRNLFVSASMLTIIGIKTLIKERTNFILLCSLLLFISSFDYFFIFSKRVAEIKTVNPWIYQSSAEKQAYDFLDRNTQDEDGVIAAFLTANHLPAHTWCRVYLGHSFQTPNFAEKMEKQVSFFSGKMETEQAKQFLQQNSINYIFWGPQEKELVKTDNLDYDFLKLVYENQKVKIFKTN